MYSKNQFKGIILLIVMTCIILISKYLKHYQAKDINNTIAKNIEIIDISELRKDSTKNSFAQNNKKIKKNTRKTVIAQKRTKTIKKKSYVFKFNPNTISYDSIIMLGVNKIAASNWIKYLEKGGKFKSKRDLAKIYNLEKKTINKLYDYILLPDTINASIKYTYKNRNKHKKTNNKKNIIIDLNTCNADDLKKLKGIGKVLSERIIKYREKLGGFYSVSQLKEVYGLPDDTYNNIKSNLQITNKNIKKIKINIAKTKDLANSPYINYRMAKQLINYRIQHGNYKSLEDLKNLKSSDPEKIKKLEPYLDFTLK